MSKRDKEQESGTLGVSVRLPRELLEAIDRIAAAERRTRGNLIRIFLEDALKQREEK